MSARAKVKLWSPAWQPVLVFMLCASSASACPVCFGAPEDPITKSISWGILFLLCVVVSVLATIAGFFFYIIRRASRMNAGMETTNLTPAAGKA